MTTTDLAAALLRGVNAYDWYGERDNDGPVVLYADILAALTAALDGVDERAGALVSQISVQQLPDEMDEDDLEAADYEAGYIGVLGLARNAADLITAQLAQIAALRAERDAADDALVDRYRDPKTGVFKFPADVAAIVRRLDAAEAVAEKLRGALREIAERPSKMTWGEEYEISDAMRDMGDLARAALTTEAGE